VMHHLTQNNEIPIFGDDYAHLTEDDTFVGSREENYLREAGNFFHHYTRDKQIMSIDWRPGKSAVAVAVMAPAGLVDRLELSQQVDSAVCLVWNFLEQANPQFILEAPADVLTLKFCPTRPNIVVGGLVNGQVVAWDLNIDADAKVRHSKHANKLRQQQHGSEDPTAIPRFDPPVPGQTLEKSGDHMVWRLKPFQQSRVEYSHRRAVQDICWLPPDVECGFDTKFIEPKEGQNQFATIGEDGVMYMWDLRPANQPEQKIKRLKNSKIPGDQPMWVPLLKWNLTRPEGNGDLIGLRFHLECKDAEGNHIYLMTCTTVEGEFATCYWGPKDERQSNQGGFEDTNRREQRVVKSLSLAHAGPGWAVQRHPLLPDYYLTVGDWGFKIWQLGLSSPILASPMSDQQVMCGRWSPTRPAVLFIGTRDGWVQVWDLLDRSHEKLFGTQVIQEAITVLEFKPTSDKRGSQASQNLAVGTKQGYFQLYELPRKLVKAHPSETRLTKQFFEREGRRVAYFSWRWKERQREMDLLRQDRGEAKAKVEDSDGAEEEADYMMSPDDDQEFFRLVDELSGKEGDDRS
jgi:WD40 repeat protein